MRALRILFALFVALGLACSWPDEGTVLTADDLSKVRCQNETRDGRVTLVCR